MLRIDLNKCTGCKRCEAACSFYHTGRISNWYSRINVLNLYETGVDGPVVCVQCSERYCMQCPVNALIIGDYGQVIVSPTICTLCGACEINCPIGAVKQFNNFVYVCDLCGGNPKCAEVCTEAAITWQPDQKPISLERLKKETEGMNPTQKQYLYLSKQGKRVRQLWSKSNA